MKNSYASKHHSISKRLSLGLVITLLVVASLSLVVNYIISSRNAKDELEIKSNEYSVALTDALRLPIWEINQETIKAIGESYSQNEFVAQLLIEGQDSLVFFKNEKPDVQSIVSRSKDILHDGKFIGRNKNRSWIIWLVTFIPYFIAHSLAIAAVMTGDLAGHFG